MQDSLCIETFHIWDKTTDKELLGRNLLDCINPRKEQDGGSAVRSVHGIESAKDTTNLPADEPVMRETPRQWLASLHCGLLLLVCNREPQGQESVSKLSGAERWRLVTGLPGGILKLPILLS